MTSATPDLYRRNLGAGNNTSAGSRLLKERLSRTGRCAAAGPSRSPKTRAA